MNERENFLKEIESHWHDYSLRLVFADWLEEHGEHEEADYQREWVKAFDWVVGFHERHRSKWRDPEDPDEYGHPEDPFKSDSYAYYPVGTPKKLVQAALAELAIYKSEKPDRRGWWSGLGIHCGANEDIQDGLRQESKDFWQRIAIIARVPITEEEAENASYSCSC